MDRLWPLSQGRMETGGPPVPNSSRAPRASPASAPVFQCDPRDPVLGHQPAGP